MLWWTKPVAGELVWCFFPQDNRLKPGPKPRPGLIIKVVTVLGEDQQFVVRVVYGTSQKVDTLYSGELLISQDEGEVFRISGLSCSTKFDMANIAELPYNDQWFGIPPKPKYGQAPKLGILHPSLTIRLNAARAAVKRLG